MAQTEKRVSEVTFALTLTEAEAVYVLKAVDARADSVPDELPLFEVVSGSMRAAGVTY